MALAKPNSIMKLVDELGEVVEQRLSYEKREDALKTLIRKSGPGAYRGKVFDALLEQRITTSQPKAELLKQYLDEETIDKCRVKSPYLKVNVTRRVALHAVK